MNEKIRAVILVTVEMKREIVASLKVSEEENFQRFVRKALASELQRRRGGTPINRNPDNGLVPDGGDNPAPRPSQPAREPLPRRSTREAGQVPDFLRREDP